VKFDYPGGILPHERPMIERFEDEVVPYIEREGPRIGEIAMQGDAVAAEIIARYRLFVEGLPDLRATNYKLLVRALKAWQRTEHTEGRSIH
jgi:hypothetical protein